MSFLNPTPVPAILYSSEDTDAPQLGTDRTGAVKTILKACLATGYGGKPGQGWVMTDETANVATFAPGDPAAPQVGLSVDSSHKDDTILNLIWRGIPQNISRNGHHQFRSGYNVSYRWFLIATPRGFAFVPLGTYRGTTCATLLYFGGINHNLIHPQAQDYILINAATSHNSGASTLPYAIRNGALFHGAGNLDTQPPTNGITANIRPTSAAAPPAGTESRRNNRHGAVLQSRAYAPITLWRTDGCIGTVPGLLCGSHAGTADGSGDIVQIDGIPGDWLHTNQTGGWGEDSDNLPLLINTGEWVY